MERLPYKQIDSIDYRYIRQIRFLRNKTLKQFEGIMGVDDTTISRIENRKIDFTPYYQELFKEACQRLRISGEELTHIRKILEIKSLKGYK